MTIKKMPSTATEEPPFNAEDVGLLRKNSKLFSHSGSYHCILHQQRKVSKMGNIVLLKTCRKKRICNTVIWRTLRSNVLVGTDVYTVLKDFTAFTTFLAEIHKTYPQQRIFKVTRSLFSK